MNQNAEKSTSSGAHEEPTRVEVQKKFNFQNEDGPIYNMTINVKLHVNTI